MRRSICRRSGRSSLCTSAWLAPAAHAGIAPKPRRWRKARRSTARQGIAEQCPERGPNIQALALYLKHFQHVSYQRLERLFSDVFGLKISQGGLGNVLRRSKPAFDAEKALILQNVRQAEAVCFTNSLFGIWPVRFLDGMEYDPAQIPEALRQGLLNYRLASADTDPDHSFGGI